MAHSRGYEMLQSVQGQVYSSIDQRKSLWMGEVDPSYMDELFIQNMYASLGFSVTVKMIRDRLTG
jgi:hypothetical protein